VATVDGAAPPAWRDPKRYLWLLGAIVPGMAAGSWLAVQVTGVSAFWWSGPLVTFVLMPALDQLIGSDADNPPENAFDWLANDRFYRWAIYLYIPNQYLSLAFVCWLWSGGGWLTMTFVDKLGLMITVGIVGGMAINAAHELGHKRERNEKRLSKIALAQTFYGHFFVEHNRGHHVRVATEEDNASSRFGESIYQFVPRSVVGGLRSAWNLEGSRLERRHGSRWTWRNDILSGWLLSAVLFATLVMWFGVVVLPWLIGQAIVGFCLLETVNYLEHYGLRRQKRPDGRYESVSAAHSWNGSTVIANIFLFHLQRHSDHHENPQRRYQTLRHAEEAPQLPAGYGAMIVLALVPPLWRRVMDRRVLEHYGNDIRLVGLSPRHRKRLEAADAALCSATS
jgi:alkane 1-monooxygenase